MVPKVMGILNVTPDSFSDGGRYLDPAKAIDHGLSMAAAGADIVDVGGESTRPGAVPVDEDVELERITPVISALSDAVRVSVDTTKPNVARAAIELGATMINDVSASLEQVAADEGVGWIAMHGHGADRVSEVRDALVERAEAGLAAGVEELWIDPGLGFGKSADDNLALLANLDVLVETGYPVVVGGSRKRFIGALLARSDGVDDVPTDDRLDGSLTVATVAMARGAAAVRVHDVAPTVQAAKVVAA